MTRPAACCWTPAAACSAGIANRLATRGRSSSHGSFVWPLRAARRWSCATANQRRTLELADRRFRVLGRSLRLRQVSAGGCNACEADTNVLNTLAWDLGRFGIQFVASPRHADGLLITGPVTADMRLALEKTLISRGSPVVHPSRIQTAFRYSLSGMPAATG